MARSRSWRAGRPGASAAPQMWTDTRKVEGSRPTSQRDRMTGSARRRPPVPAGWLSPSAIGSGRRMLGPAATSDDRDPRPLTNGFMQRPANEVLSLERHRQVATRVMISGIDRMASRRRWLGSVAGDSHSSGFRRRRPSSTRRRSTPRSRSSSPSSRPAGTPRQGRDVSRAPDASDRQRGAHEGFEDRRASGGGSTCMWSYRRDSKPSDPASRATTPGAPARRGPIPGTPGRIPAVGRSRLIVPPSLHPG